MAATRVSIVIGLLTLGGSGIPASSGTPLSSGPFEIRRSSVDAGGGIASGSTGGSTFELRSTIGQPDAGTISGGSFVLYGGFWHPLPDVTRPDPIFRNSFEG